nr:hypothetical protein Itr_chr07CG07650 [Ipomoea trifida]
MKKRETQSLSFERSFPIAGGETQMNRRWQESPTVSNLSNTTRLGTPMVTGNIQMEGDADKNSSEVTSKIKNTK